LDNLTHTLVGVLVGETAARATRSSSGLDSTTRRNLFVTLMAIGSNVPDLDFIPSSIRDSKLDYLLHHRGHTHTILGALLVAALLYVAAEAWCRWRKYRVSGIDRAQLAGIASIATLLHIAMDATNSYGVHPFWPLDNRWYYGDAVFIVEPLFWSACAPLVFVLRTMLAKILVGIALSAGVGLSFLTGMVPQPMAFTLLSITILMLVIGKIARPQVALVIALLVWFAINTTFAQLSGVADRRARAIARESLPNSQVLDVVLTPMPANPVCWQLLLVQADSANWYVRRASLSIAPSLLAATSCPSRGDVTTTATFVPVEAQSDAAIVWHGEFATNRELLRQKLESSCAAVAFMGFARAPWLIERDSKWILGDARFDYERDLSFAEIDLAAEPCMTWMPPWTPPRLDLLR
jgi:inner membrane protein